MLAQNDPHPVTEGIVVVDPLIRRSILFVVYYATKDEPNYGIMMRRVKEIQDMLEKKYNKTLGYTFQDEHIYHIWDNTLLEDLEILDLEGLIDNEDHGFQEIIYTHSLHHVTRTGKFLLKKSIKPLLEEYQIGLYEDIVTAVENMTEEKEE